MRYFEEAGERTRTVDTQLGKLVLYQLSYARAALILAARAQRTASRR
jgi:hypothetical protein